MASKTEQAFMILKERIMNGTYGPGYRLVIDQLVREHGISSVPWRESLRRLQAEGWVEIVPNVGALVATFDTDAWQQGLQIVARLGGYATALSAPHLTEADLTAAHTLDRQMKEALSAFDPARFGRLNREFHRLLACRCPDRRLVDMVDNEWARLEIVRRSAFWYAPAAPRPPSPSTRASSSSSSRARRPRPSRRPRSSMRSTPSRRSRSTRPPCPTSGSDWGTDHSPRSRHRAMSALA